MDACINKGTGQYQGAERTSAVFHTVLSDVNLKSYVFLRNLSFSESRQYDL